MKNKRLIKEIIDMIEKRKVDKILSLYNKIKEEEGYKGRGFDIEKKGGYYYLVDSKKGPLQKVFCGFKYNHNRFTKLGIGDYEALDMVVTDLSNHFALTKRLKLSKTIISTFLKVF